ncbi:MAG: precorrin-2 C(20)-methyltransferase [Desulfovibrio sp.]|nr:precorrin-2 C(20)-methyltransferase [Desulfovibrio sp.]
MYGTLYGIGVGPGAPDLLTLRAIDAMKHCDVILGATRTGNDYSRALEIARPHLPPSHQELKLDFPMTRDHAKLTAAWGLAADKTLAILRLGKNAAFLTLGDPLTYSTFAYLLTAIRKRLATCKIAVIPGITAYQAASARLLIPLCAGEEHLHILSGLASEENLTEQLSCPDTAVILKAYRNFPAIRQALKNTQRDQSVWQVSHVEQAEERLCQGLTEDDKPPYMTLLLSPKNRQD